MQINRALAELRGDLCCPEIDNQAAYQSTIDGILIRIALVDLHRYVSVCIARIHIAARHKLAILIDRRILVREGIDFAVVGRGLRRCRRGLCCIEIGRSTCEVLR